MNDAICKTCYRTSKETEMQRNLMGEISETCVTCYSIIGKGPGYDDNASDVFAEEWYKGTAERREKLVKDGRIDS